MAPLSLSIACAFDLICPWCWIGKVNLERALIKLTEQHPNVLIQIEWRSIQLIPGVPEHGWDFAEFYQRRLGSQAAVALRQQQVIDAATDAGLKINFDKIKIFPNTAMAHALLHYTNELDSAAAYQRLQERLFKAYFVLGEDLGNRAQLFDISDEVGINAATQKAWLINPYLTGINPAFSSQAGVPNFTFNQKVDVSGAQSPEHLLALMLAVLAEPNHNADSAAVQG